VDKVVGWFSHRHLDEDADGEAGPDGEKVAVPAGATEMVREYVHRVDDADRSANER